MPGDSLRWVGTGVLRAPKRLAELLGAVYRLVTHQPPTPRVQAALEQFPLYAAGTGLARALSILAQLAVAHALGPEQFGRFSLSLGIGLILSTPTQDAWGTGFVRFAAVRPAGTSPWHILRALNRVAALCCAVTAIGALMSAPLAIRWLTIPLDVYVVGVIMSVPITMWLVAKSSCQGLQAWARLITIEIGWATLILVGPWAVRWAAGGFDWRIIGVFLASYVLSASVAVPLWLRRPEASVAEQTQRIWHFGKYLIGASVVVSLLLYGDRILVNCGAGLQALGIYQVYALSTVGVATFIAQLVNRFMLPLLNLGDPSAFRRLFLQALPWAAATLLPALFAAGTGTILLLRYPFDPLALGLAAISGLALCVMSFLNYLVVTEDARGPRTVLAANLAVCAIFFPLTAALVGRYPLAAPFLAYALAFTSGALLSWWRLADRRP